MAFLRQLKPVDSASYRQVERGRISLFQLGRHCLRLSFNIHIHTVEFLSPNSVVTLDFVQNDEVDGCTVAKKRHLLLTLYLGLLIFSALFGLVCYLIALISGEDLVSEVLLIDPPLFLYPVWFTCVQILICISDLVAFAGFFKWRKWGFWLYVCNTFVNFSVYSLLYGDLDNIIYSGLAVLLLYGILQLGGNKKGWTQLD